MPEGLIDESLGVITEQVPSAQDPEHEEESDEAKAYAKTEAEVATSFMAGIWACFVT